MCTIGALRLADGSTVLFKNKDFARSPFSDRIQVEVDWFGPSGFESFADAETGRQSDTWSGLSIGGNRFGLLCCVNHVRSTDVEGSNYDLLVEHAVTTATSVDGAIAGISERVADHPSWWGNLILADKSGMAALEVRGDKVNVDRSADRVFRTNHQPSFGETESPDGVPCSASRFDAAASVFDGIDSIGSLRAMLSSHDRGVAGVNRTGICNHGDAADGGLSTVYSYILHQSGRDLTLHVASGNPCRSPWRMLTVPIGANWSPAAAQNFIVRYPQPVS